MGGDTSHVTNPAPPDPTAGLAVTASASVDKMAMYVGGQVMQTQMMTNLMNLQGSRDTMLQQDKLDARLEIAHLNYEARTAEAEMRHEETMSAEANEHVETLAGAGAISLDSGDYSYPYQWGEG
jgi:hypothetical protein